MDQTKYEEYIDDIICYLLHVHFEKLYFTVEDFELFLKRRYSVEFKIDLIRCCFSRLFSKELIEFHDDPFTDGFYNKTEKISEWFDNQIDIRGSITWKCVNNADWFFKALKNIADVSFNQSSHIKTDQNVKLTKNNKDQWAPLPLEREGQDFENAIRGIEDVIKQLRESNGYGDNEDDQKEKESILESLKTGLYLIKKVSPTKEQAQALLLQPIIYLTLKFADGLIAEAARLALPALRLWTGL